MALPLLPAAHGRVPARGAARVLLFLGLAALALAGAGCSKTYERQLYETPCGDGRLRLVLHVTTHPPAPNEVKLWIVLDAAGQRRTVDVVKPRATMYAPPTPAERFARLRPGPDDWPVFVSPRLFTPAEYELIRARLQAVLAELDTALATEAPGERLDYGNLARFSSTRYTDYEGFRRVYAGSRKGVTVELFPNGEIWCRHPAGMTLAGSVVDGGRRALLPEGYGLLEKAGIADPIEFVLSCRTPEGGTLASQFAVERVTNKAYEQALRHERAERAKR